FMVSPGPGRADIQFGNDQRPLATPVRDRQLLERVDHNFSERDQFSARYMIDDVVKRVGGSTGFPGFDTGNKQRFQNVLASETHTFSPAATNELRLAYNRILISVPNDAVNPLAATLPFITIAGTFSGASTLGVNNAIPQ